MMTMLKGENTSFCSTINTYWSRNQYKGYKVISMKEILKPTSILDIIKNFVLFTHEKELLWMKKLLN